MNFLQSVSASNSAVHKAVAHRPRCDLTVVLVVGYSTTWLRSSGCSQDAADNSGTDW